MTRPCDRCGGSGEVMEDSAVVFGIPGGLVPQGCPACAKMPWLPGNRYGHSEGQVYADKSPRCSKFKPDPSCVLRWCQTHNSVAVVADLKDTCQVMLAYSLSEERTAELDCEIGWIERPTPLEEADD